MLGKESTMEENTQSKDDSLVNYKTSELTN